MPEITIQNPETGQTKTIVIDGPPPSKEAIQMLYQKVFPSPPSSSTGGGSPLLTPPQLAARSQMQSYLNTVGRPVVPPDFVNRLRANARAEQLDRLTPASMQDRIDPSTNLWMGASDIGNSVYHLGDIPRALGTSLGSGSPQDVATALTQRNPLDPMNYGGQGPDGQLLTTPDESSVGGAIARRAGRGVLPALTGAAGASYLAPIGLKAFGPIGGLVAGAAGALGGAGLADYGQSELLKTLLGEPAYNEVEKRYEKDTEQHPVASFVGEQLPYLGLFKPSLSTSVEANINRAIGGAIPAASELVGQLRSGKVDPIRLGATFLSGAAMSGGETALGEHVTSPFKAAGESVAGGIRPFQLRPRTVLPQEGAPSVTPLASPLPVEENAASTLGQSQVNDRAVPQLQGPITPEEGVPFSRLAPHTFEGMRQALTDTYGYTPEQAHESARYLESAARPLAEANNMSVEDWYRNNLKAITRGGEPIAQELTEEFNRANPDNPETKLPRGAQESAGNATQRNNLLEPGWAGTPESNAIDSRKIVYALSDPDTDTGVHEFNRVIFDNILKTAKPEEVLALRKWAGLKGQDAWSDTHLDKAADAMDLMLAKGEAPHPSLQSTFDKFKGWIKNVYNLVTGGSVAKQLGVTPFNKRSLAIVHSRFGDVSDIPSYGEINNGVNPPVETRRSSTSESETSPTPTNPRIIPVPAETGGTNGERSVNGSTVGASVEANNRPFESQPAEAVKPLAQGQVEPLPSHLPNPAESGTIRSDLEAEKVGKEQMETGKLPAEQATFEGIKKLLRGRTGEHVFDFDNGAKVTATTKVQNLRGGTVKTFAHLLIEKPNGAWERYREKADGSFTRTDYGKGEPLQTTHHETPQATESAANSPVEEQTTHFGNKITEISNQYAIEPEHFIGDESRPIPEAADAVLKASDLPNDHPIRATVEDAIARGRQRLNTAREEAPRAKLLSYDPKTGDALLRSADEVNGGKKPELFAQRQQAYIDARPEYFSEVGNDSKYPVYRVNVKTGESNDPDTRTYLNGEKGDTGFYGAPIKADGINVKLKAGGVDLKVISKHTEMARILAHSLGHETPDRSGGILFQRANPTKPGTPVSSTEESGSYRDQQEQTPAFKNWFGDWQNDPANASKVVDENGKPLVMYHGTPAPGHSQFMLGRDSMLGLFGDGYYFTNSPEIASEYSENRQSPQGDRPGLYPVYLDVKKPFDMEAVYTQKEASRIIKSAVNGANRPSYRGEQASRKGIQSVLDEVLPSALTDKTQLRGEDIWNAVREIGSRFAAGTYEKKAIGNNFASSGVKSLGYDGIAHEGGGRYSKYDPRTHQVYIAFEPNQIKSATGNNGEFSPSNSDIRFQRANPAKQGTPVGSPSSTGGGAAPTPEPVSPKPTPADEPPTFAENAATLVKIGMTNLTTPVKILAEGAGKTLGNEVSRIPGSFADMARVGFSKLLGGENTAVGRAIGTNREMVGVSVPDINTATARANNKLIPDLVSIMKTGKPTSNLTGEVSPTLGVRHGLPETGPLGWVGTAYNKAIATHSAAQQVWINYATERSITDQARLIARGEKNASPSVDEQARVKELSEHPTEQMIIRAASDALGAVGLNDNWASKGFSKFKGAIDDNPAGKFFAEMALPFTKIGVNSAATNLDYFTGAPLGLLNATGKIIHDVPLHQAHIDAQAKLTENPTAEARKALDEAAKNLINLKFNSQAKARLAQAIGRNAGGAAIAFVGSVLASQGQVTGYAVHDRDRQLRERSGVPEGSILLGERWYPLATFGPPGALLAIGATMREQAAKHSDDPAVDQFLQSYGEGLITQAKEVPLATTGFLPDFSKGEAADAFTQSAAHTFIPSYVNTAAQISDSSQPRARKIGGESPKFHGIPLAPIMERIPGLRQRLDTKPQEPLGRLHAIDPTHSIQAGGVADPDIYRPRGSGGSGLGMDLGNNLKMNTGMSLKL